MSRTTKLRITLWIRKISHQFHPRPTGNFVRTVSQYNAVGFIRLNYSCANISPDTERKLMIHQDHQLAMYSREERKFLLRTMVAIVGSLLVVLAALVCFTATTTETTNDVDNVHQLRVVHDSFIPDDRGLFSRQRILQNKFGGGGYAPICPLYFARGAVKNRTVPFLRDSNIYDNPDCLLQGDYLVHYVDGCMRWGDSNSFNWTVHYNTAYRYTLATVSGRVLGELPGTMNVTGYAKFEDCVNANMALPPTVFRHAGGPLYVYCVDALYTNNLNGNPNPTWSLQSLACLVL